MFWTVYSKDGKERKASNGAKVIIRSLEYSGEWMGECSVISTITSESPISFGIGDYIVYRGETFSLRDIPTVKKVARPRAYAESFTYQSVKFLSASAEMGACAFLDYVPNDNYGSYSSLPKFDFYAMSVRDLAARLQANLDRLYNSTPSPLFDKDGNRLMDSEGYYLNESSKSMHWTFRIRLETEDELYYDTYTNGVVNANGDAVERHEVLSNDMFPGKKNLMVSSDSIMCNNALEYVQTLFKLNYTIRGRVVYIGTNGVKTEHTFTYGKGNGLKDIQASEDTQNKVITRLHAYGSTKNLPIRYYAEMGCEVFYKFLSGEGSYEYTLSDDITKRKAYPIDERINLSAFITTESLSIAWKHGEEDYRTTTAGRVIGHVTHEGRTYLVNALYAIMPVKVGLVDEYKPMIVDIGGNMNESWVKGSKLYFQKTSNQFVSIKLRYIPNSHREYGNSNPITKTQMAIPNLMLPGFPLKSLDSQVKIKTEGFSYSSEPLNPYIESDISKDFGVREGTVFFDKDDPDNGIIEIYPTIEEMTAGDAGVSGFDPDFRLDTILVGSDFKDADGNHVEIGTDGDLSNVTKLETIPEQFRIKVPVFGFDFGSYIQSDTAIVMRDGMCGSRRFPVAGFEAKDGGMIFVLNRVEGNNGEYFPHKDAQIKAGDHFVFDSIELPDKYIEAASRKMLRYAEDYLKNYCSPKIVYSPTIDDIWMARQHEDAMQSGGISLHDTIKEGDVMSIKDDDLGVEEDIIIDQLRIVEGESRIPKHTVVLRNEKSQSAVRRILKL